MIERRRNSPKFGWDQRPVPLPRLGEVFDRVDLSPLGSRVRAADAVWSLDATRICADGVTSGTAALRAEVCMGHSI